MNKFLQAFKNEISWFIKEKDDIEILSEGKSILMNVANLII